MAGAEGSRPRAGAFARLFRRGAPDAARPDAARPDAASPGRLVLHLGDFKTGSTAIQSWLRAHGAAHGIAIPPGFNQAALAQSLTGPPGAADAAFAALARDLGGGGGDGGGAGGSPHLVLSAEHFEMSPPERLAGMLDRHLPGLARDARAVVYVRPHPDALLARFAESVKIGGHMGDLAAYLALPPVARRLAYGTRLSAWAAVFGDRLCVRLFDPADFPGGDVVRDFARLVTGRDPGPQPAPAFANPTPGLADLSRARALHLAVGPVPQEARFARFTLGRAWGRVLAEAGAGGPDIPLRLDRGLAQRLADLFGEEAARADALFFPGQPLTRALGAAVAEAPAEAPGPDPALHLSAGERAAIRRMGRLLRLAFDAPGGPGMIDRLWHE